MARHLAVSAFQAARNPKPPLPARVSRPQQEQGLRGIRDQHAATSIGSSETGGDDSGYRERLAAEIGDLAHDIGVRIEAVAPDSLAQHYNRGVSGVGAAARLKSVSAMIANSPSSRNSPGASAHRPAQTTMSSRWYSTGVITARPGSR